MRYKCAGTVVSLSLLTLILSISAVRGDGFAWGQNFYGQLGDGTTVDRLRPVPIKGIDNIQAVTLGSSHSVALKKDGTVWSWGNNQYGQLGDGTTTDRKLPGPVITLVNISDISAGFYHNLALRADGTVWAWGSSYLGALGDGTWGDYWGWKPPQPVPGMNGAVAVTAGVHDSLALKADGTVWAWGLNDYGQLGVEASTVPLTTPGIVPGIQDVVAIAAARAHSLALKADGTVWAWGHNLYGELGDGTFTDRPVPMQVHGLNNVTAIATGYMHSLALRSDGTVWAWGWNYSGQIGDGTTTDRPIPVQVPGLSNVVALSTGVLHSYALKSDGTVWTWGANSDGQLGDGTRQDRYSPQMVSGFAGFTGLPRSGIGYCSVAFPGAIGSGIRADAGPDQTITVPHDGDPVTNTATFTLDGSQSYGDSLSYEWSEGGTVIATSPTVTLTRTAGVYTFTLKVTDSHGAVSTDDVKVTVLPEVNRAPKANAGPDQTIYSTAAVNVVLNGGGSSDPDNDPLAYSWTEGGTQIATGKIATVLLGVGSHTITLTVTDPYGATGSDTVVILVTNQTTTIALDMLSINYAYVGGSPPVVTATGSGYMPGAVITWNGTPLPTTFLSSTQVTTKLTAAQIAVAGVFQVQVKNPDGGLSNARPFTVLNRLPYITSINPAVVTHGGAGFTLEVIGHSFLPGSLVYFRGYVRTTTYVSATMLTIQVTAEDIAAIGTAEIRVTNPTPGGGMSNGKTLIIQ